MWAFAYLCILASLIWYFKLIHILSENSAQYYSRLLKTSEYAANYENNVSVKDKDKILEEDQLHTEKIHDFKLVENRIDEIIKGAKDEIAILFCNSSTLKINETQSILRFLKEKTRSDIIKRILFPLGVEGRTINSYSEIANVRIFEKKMENNSIIIVSDYTKVLVVRLQILSILIRKQRILYHILTTKI